MGLCLGPGSIKLPASAECFLLIVAHHLVVDGFSWRIILEDLVTTYNQLRSGAPLKLPAKTTSFRDWATSSLAYSSSPAILAEAEQVWIKNSAVNAPSIPVIGNAKNSDNKVRDTATCIDTLDEFTTSALLGDAHTAYNTRINELLLAALVVAFNDVVQVDKLLLSMEGHGREELVDLLDVSRTVGWFTAVYPVLLELDDADGMRSVIRQVKEQLRAIPANGNRVWPGSLWQWRRAYKACT